MCFEPTLCDGDGIVERRDDGYYGGCRVIAVANGIPACKPASTVDGQGKARGAVGSQKVNHNDKAVSRRCAGCVLA